MLTFSTRAGFEFGNGLVHELSQAWQLLFHSVELAIAGLLFDRLREVSQRLYTKYASSAFDGVSAAHDGVGFSGSQGVLQPRDQFGKFFDAGFDDRREDLFVVFDVL